VQQIWSWYSSGLAAAVLFPFAFRGLGLEPEVMGFPVRGRVPEDENGAAVDGRLAEPLLLPSEGAGRR
jgi:hypothetical protein